MADAAKARAEEKKKKMPPGTAVAAPAAAAGPALDQPLNNTNMSASNGLGGGAAATLGATATATEVATVGLEEHQQSADEAQSGNELVKANDGAGEEFHHQDQAGNAHNEQGDGAGALKAKALDSAHLPVQVVSGGSMDSTPGPAPVPVPGPAVGDDGDDDDEEDTLEAHGEGTAQPLPAATQHVAHQGPYVQMLFVAFRMLPSGFRLNLPLRISPKLNSNDMQNGFRAER